MKSGVKSKVAQNNQNEKILAGILLLLICCVVGVPILYFLSRAIAPALTMGLVHLVTLPAYFIFWAILYLAIAFACLFIGAKYLQNLALILVALIAVLHSFAGNGLGELALYQIYGSDQAIQGIPIPATESAKFIPRNVAETRLKTTGDNSQLNVGEIDEAIIDTSSGDSHIGFAATMRARDFETKLSGETELVYIDAHNSELKRQKIKLAVLPGGTVNSDPERAFYSALPWWDLTSHNVGEIVPIINEKDNTVKLAMPMETPRTRWVGIFPLSNIPTYSGIVLIDPVTGRADYMTVNQVQTDPILSRARLFPHNLAKKVSESSRFAGVNTSGDLFRALLPSNVSAFANFTLAPEPEEAGQWPALYTSGQMGKEKAFLYFPYLPNSSSRALVREVSIDADSGTIHVREVNGIASPRWIIDSVLKQILATEQLLQSSFGQFDEPTPVEIGGERYYVFPITSKQGSAVIAYAVSGTKISDQSGQVQVQFLKTPTEVEKWLGNPQFTSQNLREVFLGQTVPAAAVTQQTQSQTSDITRLEGKLDAQTRAIEDLTKAIQAQQKK